MTACPTALFTRAAWFIQDGIERVGGASADYGIYNMPYKVPHRHHERHNAKTHIPSSTHRAPGANQLGFMAEVFVDEMAIAGGWDPLEWRIKMTKGLADWQLVLKTLKEKAGFRTDLPKGEGMGVAVVESHGSIAAACATVTVSRRGRLNIEKVLLVLDAAASSIRMPPPSSAKVRSAGNSHMPGLAGSSWKRPFRQYQFRHLQPAPHRPESACRDIFASSGGTKWGGLGEPAGPPAPPAVANAIYYATGKRIRSTPFRSQDLTWRDLV